MDSMLETRRSAEGVAEKIEQRYKLHCVTQVGSKFYYPKTIPKERSSLAVLISIGICIALVIADFFTNNVSAATFFALYAYGFLWNVVLHLVHRITLMFEEYNHLTSRYDMNYLLLLKDGLFFHATATIAIVSCIIYVVYYICSGHHIEPEAWNRNIVLYLIPTVFLMGKIVQLKSCALNDSLSIAQINGLDYGSGMAYSFFYGYLNLVLRKTGTEEKSLKELMEDYESVNGIKFKAYKLFILIPLSLRCFVSLKNEFSPSVDESMSLPKKTITLAGVQNRIYKNAVYKIDDGKNNKVYVSAEYATPLKTFNDVLDNTGDHSLYYKKLKNEISLQFYLTLKKVLQRTGLDEFCEPIFSTIPIKLWITKHVIMTWVKSF